MNWWVKSTELDMKHLVAVAALLLCAGREARTKAFHRQRGSSQGLPPFKARAPVTLSPFSKPPTHCWTMGNLPLACAGGQVRHTWREAEWRRIPSRTPRSPSEGQRSQTQENPSPRKQSGLQRPLTGAQLHRGFPQPLLQRRGWMAEGNCLLWPELKA